MLDLSNELKVANEFWDFIGGVGAYQDLLDIFEKVGIELRQEIDDYFAKYNKLTWIISNEDSFIISSVLALRRAIIFPEQGGQIFALNN